MEKNPKKKLRSIGILTLINILIIIRVFKVNLKMGFYKFYTTLYICESIGSIFKGKSENNDNNPFSKEYISFLKWFVGFTDVFSHRNYSSSSKELSL